jgi:hypothetical protein
LKIRDNIDFDTIIQDNQKLKAKITSLENKIKSIQETLFLIFSELFYLRLLKIF